MVAQVQVLFQFACFHRLRLCATIFHKGKETCWYFFSRSRVYEDSFVGLDSTWKLGKELLKIKEGFVRKQNGYQKSYFYAYSG